MSPTTLTTTNLVPPVSTFFSRLLSLPCTPDSPTTSSLFTTMTFMDPSISLNPSPQDAPILDEAGRFWALTTTSSSSLIRCYSEFSMRNWESLWNVSTLFSVASFIACVVLPKEEANFRMAAGAKRPWAMAYDPSVEKWEPLPDPPHRPRYHPMFTTAIDGGGQWGPCIVVPWDCLLQIYHVYAKCWELRRFDCDHIFGFPLDKFVTANSSAGVAVAVETKLYWYMAYKQCLV
ncbi:hypothetical protein RHGRI_000767 [Rhododendron griersonianum]|uniref:Uncharacterized protein n=1 Tax=Rhododendron griersonianum TaxID=479676 RepID=A0AAV6LK28_9ERIC|nr:hypothetical protein RHGRI_000767 [Rhododendron griersonianum]